MIRLRSLGSGSSGNATVVEARGLRTRRLLIDCGLGPRILAQRLAASGLALEQIDALFITHEHSDHIGCAHRIATSYRIPIWMSEGTWQATGQADFEGLLHLCADGQRIDLGEMEICAFAVPHDAREPLQLSCSDGADRLGVLTDLGHITEPITRHLADCSALLLECNHDSGRLATSSYPDFLKRRIGGPLGHLSNERAACFAKNLQRGQLKQIVAAHLSRSNNQPDLALKALHQALGTSAELSVADATLGSTWMGTG